MLKTIEIENVLPDYLISIWYFISSVGFLEIVLISIGLWIAYIIIVRLIALSLSLRQSHVFLEVKPSYKSFKTPFSTEQLFTVLHAIQTTKSIKEKLLRIKRYTSFELISTKEGGIRYMLRVPQEDASILKKTLLAYAQTNEISEHDDYIHNSNNLYIRELRLTRPFVYPLQEQTLLKESDSIAYVAAQMTKLAPDELIALQIISSPVAESTHPGIVNNVKNIGNLILSNEDITSATQTGMVWNILNCISNLKKKRITELSTSKQNHIKAVEQKIYQPLFESSIRLLVYGKSTEQRYTRMKGLLSSFEAFTSPTQAIKPNPHS